MQVGVVHDAADRLGDELGPAPSGEEEATVSHRLRDGRAPAGDHRHVERHRLEQGHTETLVLAHGHERDRAPEHRRQLGVVDRSDNMNLGEIELADLGAHRIRIAGEAVLAHEQEPSLNAEVGRGDVHRLDEQVRALVREQLADEEQHRLVELTVEIA